MKPYYQDDKAGITIYHGDCREVLPQLPPFDLVLTDPPYPDYYVDLYLQTPIAFLTAMPCRQYVFWSAKCEFPIDHTAIHIWDKKSGAGAQYERIFERNGQRQFNVYRYYLINSTIAASFTRDEFTKHRSQKPIQLIRRLVADGSSDSALIFDPFMGSGTTLVAAKQLGRRAIGVEIEEHWCEVAAKRLQQEVMPLFAESE